MLGSFALLKLLTRGGCYAGGSPVLAVLAYADGNGGPTYPLPFPALKKRCGITVTDSRGFSPHSSNLERLVTLPITRRLSSIFGCVLPVSPPNRGGVNPQTFAACNLRYDSVPRITLLTNYPTFCQQFRPERRSSLTTHIRTPTAKTLRIISSRNSQETSIFSQNMASKK